MNVNNVLNQALVATAKTMYKEGFVTEDQYVHFVNNYFFVAHQPVSMWDKLRRKLFSSRDENQTYYDVMKLIQPDDQEEDLELETLRRHRETEAADNGKAVIKRTRFSEVGSEANE